MCLKLLSKQIEECDVGASVSIYSASPVVRVLSGCLLSSLAKEPMIVTV